MTSEQDIEDSGHVDGNSVDDEETNFTKADVFIDTGYTPEEYVLAMIESNGRRLKQQTICDLTGWSEGAVSRTLSEMEDSGMITRLRIGREKVVFLPDAKPELSSLSDTDEETR